MKISESYSFVWYLCDGRQNLILIFVVVVVHK